MHYRWWSFLALATVLCAVGFAQKGQVQDKPDPLAKPDPTVKAQNWRITPIKVAPRNPADYVRYTPRGDFFPASGATVTVNVAGTPSVDGQGADCNARLVVDAPSGYSYWNAFGVDVQLTAYSISWLSDIVVLITNVDGDGILLVPARGDNFSGTGSYSTGGLHEFCGVYGLPPLFLPDGKLYLEFFEAFNDLVDCEQDGNWDSGSLTFEFITALPFTGHDETGDAGDLPESAQATPSGALAGIRGALTPNDVDMYVLYIDNPTAFSATTRCGTSSNTQLFLFDANGNPVGFNDDTPNSGSFHSTIDGSCVPAPGLYYLAISAFDRDAINCNTAEIWPDSPGDVIRCSASARAGRVAGWFGSHNVNASYIIQLTGASGASPAALDACPPFAGWDEFADGGSDAGELPETSQSTGSDALPGIRGQLDASDSDMYAIYIDDPASFSATTVGGATFDTQLWLFDANGKGVVANDDADGGRQSRIDNTAGCITAPGVYYLAVSRYLRVPIGCEGGNIWFGPSNNCPNGAEPNSRVASWEGNVAAEGEYRVFLTGVRGATRGDPADCPPPPADRWDEQRNGGGDAGDLSSNAQPIYRADQTPCQSPVTRINGALSSSNDADIYVICITDPANFTASTSGLTGFDSQLWLFRCDGRGVVHNDDTDGRQSRLDNSTGCLNGLQAGTYLLAVTAYDQDPVDANGNPLWNDEPFGAIRCPDGAGANNPLAGWDGSGIQGDYGVTLTGAYFVAQGGCVSCEGDANRDGRVDDADLLIVLFNFGSTGGQGDVDNNGTVDDADLLIVLFNFGCGS
jgi:hypothetical protein